MAVLEIAAVRRHTDICSQQVIIFKSNRENPEIVNHYIEDYLQNMISRVHGRSLQKNEPGAVKR
jgi:hypothetical protein